MIFTDMYDAVNLDGLFNILGKAFNAQNTLNTARGTTVPTDVLELLELYNDKADGTTLDLQRTIDNIAAASQSWQDNGALATALRTSSENYMTEIVKADSEQPPATLIGVLDYLIFEMQRLDAYVDPSVVSLTLAEDPDAIGNIGDVAILYTEYRGDGRLLEGALAEVVDIEVTSDASATAPGLTFSGERSEANALSYRWPRGAGINRTVTATDPATSLISNGTFETTTIENIPDGWTIETGSPGNTVVVTNPEIQTVVVAGSPLSGSYLLYWVDTEGTQRSTVTLAYNASASTLQTALQAIPGLDSVTVAATGTSPNLTHTITFTGVAGQLNQLTSTNHLVAEGGAPTITHATTRQGNNGAFRGRALGIVGDGSEQTTLMQPLTLAAETVYFCAFRLRRINETTGGEQSTSSSSSVVTSSSSSSSTSSSSSSSSSSTEGSSSSSSTGVSTSSSSSSTGVSTSSSPSSSSQSRSSYSSSSSSSDVVSSSSSSQSAEELRVEIVEGVDSPATRDSAGNENSLRIDLAAIIDAGHSSQFFSFRLARDPVQPVYLRIRCNTGLTLGDAIYIDDLIVIAATELYAGGPFVGAMIGKTAAVLEDNWSLTVANDRGGEVQEWFHRSFDMNGKRLLLPTSGTNQIPDTVIA